MQFIHYFNQEIFPECLLYNKHRKYGSIQNRYEPAFMEPTSYCIQLLLKWMDGWMVKTNISSVRSALERAKETQPFIKEWYTHHCSLTGQLSFLKIYFAHSYYPAFLTLPATPPYSTWPAWNPLILCRISPISSQKSSQTNSLANSGNFLL